MYCFLYSKVLYFLLVCLGTNALFSYLNLFNKSWRVHLYSPLTACGSRMLSTKGGQSESVDSLVEILEFTHFARIFKFNRTPEYREDSHKTILKKEISHEIKVSVVMELVWVDTKMYRSQIQSLQKKLINNWIIGKSKDRLFSISLWCGAGGLFWF